MPLDNDDDLNADNDGDVWSPEQTGPTHQIPVKEFTELSGMALKIMTSLAGAQLRVNDPETIDTAYELIDAMSQDAKESILAHYDFLCDIQDEMSRGRL